MKHNEGQYTSKMKSKAKTEIKKYINSKILKITEQT